jgi:hypothetical protein
MVAGVTAECNTSNSTHDPITGATVLFVMTTLFQLLSTSIANGTVPDM